ncbi:hypothetical protein RCH08_004924, partial [Janthinobacterium sp. CG_S6]|nr:hypothetical protein [Janthinobacterium sp. CG_S6]
TGRALPHWHVKLFIVFRSTFKEKFLTWVDWGVRYCKRTLVRVFCCA